MQGQEHCSAGGKGPVLPPQQWHHPFGRQGASSLVPAKISPLPLHSHQFAACGSELDKLWNHQSFRAEVWRLNKPRIDGTNAAAFESGKAQFRAGPASWLQLLRSAHETCQIASANFRGKSHARLTLCGAAQSPNILLTKQWQAKVADVVRRNCERIFECSAHDPLSSSTVCKSNYNHPLCPKHMQCIHLMLAQTLSANCMLSLRNSCKRTISND